MSKGLKKFKKRLYIKSVIQSLILGISLGTMTIGALVACIKLERIDMQLPISYAVGGVVALFVSLICFLILKPNDKKIAKKLDEKLGLREKTQTMLEFSGKSGDMIEIQREDADRRLREAPSKIIGFWDLLKYVPTIVLAVLVVISGYAIPTKSEEPPEIIPPVPFEISEWQIMSLRELIEKVENSDLVEPAKANSVKSLEALLTTLYTVETEPEMKEAVISTITEVTREVDAVNSYYTIRTSLKKDEISAMICGAMGTLEAPIPEGGTDELMNALTVKEKNEETITYKNPEEITESVMTFADKVSNRLRAVYREGEDDLGDAIYSLVDKLYALCEQGLTGLSGEKAAIAVSEVVNSSLYSIEDVLYVQNVNEDTGEMIRKELMRIFGISREELPKDLLTKHDSSGNPVDEEYDEDDDLEDVIGDGGAGSGEIIYGSNDTIFYPDENKYVKFGEVMNIYSGEFQKLYDAGLISDEAYNFMKYYYAALSGSLEEE